MFLAAVYMHRPPDRSPMRLNTTTKLSDVRCVDCFGAPPFSRSSDGGLVFGALTSSRLLKPHHPCPSCLRLSCSCVRAPRPPAPRQGTGGRAPRPPAPRLCPPNTTPVLPKYAIFFPRCQPTAADGTHHHPQPLPQQTHPWHEHARTHNTTRVPLVLMSSALARRRPFRRRHRPGL